MKREFRTALMFLSSLLSAAAPALASQALAKQTCAVDDRSPSEADDARFQEHYADAERLYRATLATDPSSIEAMAGLVRTLIDEDNGKRERLNIDTGVSGLLLSRAAAKTAGLVPELDAETRNTGAPNPSAPFVTHVDDLHIGGMEFKNCIVRVLAASNLRVLQDGFIGLDVFRNYVVTLDIPSREVRLGLMPSRSGEKTAQPTSLNTSDAGIRQTIADQAGDRYVAPEMKDWTPVYCVGPYLILPTVVGNAPTKLFVMDTANWRDVISAEAAREVAHVSTSCCLIKDGAASDVLVADKVGISFAGLHRTIEKMAFYDNTSMSRYAGIEISGVLGFPTLRELIVSIDYRDNLVHIVYDPGKGFHAH